VVENRPSQRSVLVNTGVKSHSYLIADYARTQTVGPGQLWTLNRLPATYDPFFNPPFVNLAALGVTPEQALQFRAALPAIRESRRRRELRDP